MESSKSPSPMTRRSEEQHSFLCRSEHNVTHDPQVTAAELKICHIVKEDAAWRSGRTCHPRRLHQVPEAGTCLLGGANPPLFDWDADSRGQFCNIGSASLSSIRTHGAPCATKSSIAFVITPPSARVLGRNRRDHALAHVFYEAPQEDESKLGCSQLRSDSDGLPLQAATTDV